MSQADQPSEPSFRGLPIYQDSVERGIHDPAVPNPDDWSPATSATRKLWRCFEALQKLNFLLPSISNEKPESQKRRFLIQFVVPLTDLFKCIVDLANAIEGDKQTRGQLSDEQLQKLRSYRGSFERVVGQAPELTNLRNKLGAHTDDSIWPHAAAELLDAVTFPRVGGVLHAAIYFLDTLVSFDCYAWTSRGYEDKQIRLMNSEPVVLVLNKENPYELPGFELTESPKRHIAEAVIKVIELSGWMIPEGKPRLRVKVDIEPSETP